MTEIEEIQESYGRQRKVIQTQLDHEARYNDCRMLLISLWDTERRAMRQGGAYALCGASE